jgi:hypothetical protein
VADNVASGRVLIKVGFRKGEVLKGVYEVVDPKSGEKEMKDVTCWSLERHRE